METDMTKGKPMGIIVRFFIPMFIGNLFQQIYNVVDSIVVGRFVGNEAFAAVGSCFLIMSFMSYGSICIFFTTLWCKTI